jgi:uncharacterized protein YndB with AHSA1/START domain
MREIKVSREFDYSVDVLWEAITDPSAIEEWLMPNDFQAQLGHEFTMKTEPRPGFDGIVSCRVVSIDPPRKMQWEWSGGGQDTTVTFICESISAERCRLTIIHSGFKGFRGLMISSILRLGWRSILKRKIPVVLQDRSSNGQIA